MATFTERLMAINPAAVTEATGRNIQPPLPPMAFEAPGLEKQKIKAQSELAQAQLNANNLIKLAELAQMRRRDESEHDLGLKQLAASREIAQVQADAQKELARLESDRRKEERDEAVLKRTSQMAAHKASLKAHGDIVRGIGAQLEKLKKIEKPTAQDLDQIRSLTAALTGAENDLNNAKRLAYADRFQIVGDDLIDTLGIAKPQAGGGPTIPKGEGAIGTGRTEPGSPGAVIPPANAQTPTANTKARGVLGRLFNALPDWALQRAGRQLGGDVATGLVPSAPGAIPPSSASGPAIQGGGIPASPSSAMPFWNAPDTGRGNIFQQLHRRFPDVPLFDPEAWKIRMPGDGPYVPKLPRSPELPASTIYDQPLAGIPMQRNAGGYMRAEEAILDGHKPGDVVSVLNPATLTYEPFELNYDPVRLGLA